MDREKRRMPQALQKPLGTLTFSPHVRKIAVVSRERQVSVSLCSPDTTALFPKTYG